MKIDFERQWFEIYRQLQLTSHILPIEVANWLNDTKRVAAVSFVSQSTLPEGEAYEAFIYRTNQVPTRNNAHDFFNGLMWLSMPLTKRALNVLQATQIAQAGVTPTRGAARDAATLFDENGAILVTQNKQLLEAWRARDWQRLFVTLRSAWMGDTQEAKLLIFGHATLEKCLKPYKAITTHTLWLDMRHDSEQTDIDAQLAANIQRIAAKDWQPLPIMGVPGWWLAELGEQDAAFYADDKVFRNRAAQSLDAPTKQGNLGNRR